jgi:hypothetical protein
MATTKERTEHSLVPRDYAQRCANGMDLGLLDVRFSDKSGPAASDMLDPQATCMPRAVKSALGLTLTLLRS